jgi:hypothetical protein
MRRLQRPEQLPLRIGAIEPHAQAVGNPLIVRGQSRVEALPQHFARGEYLVAPLDIGSAALVRHEARRRDDIDRRRRPRLIRVAPPAVGSPGRTGLRADRRGARAPLGGELKRKLVLGVDPQHRVRQIGDERHPEPYVETVKIDAPARRRVADRRGSQPETLAPRAHFARLAVDRQAPALVEHPAGCAAQLLVHAHRKVEREHHIAKVDADPLRRLIAAHAVAQPILSRPDVEQPAVIFVRRPIVGRYRDRRLINGMHAGGNKPHQRQSGENRRLPSCKRRADHHPARFCPCYAFTSPPDRPRRSCRRRFRDLPNSECERDP